VIDLSAELDADDVVAVLAEAVGRRRVSVTELRRLLADTTRHPNRRLIDELVGEVASGSRSPLEVRYACDVERAHGLPDAVRQEGPVSRYATDVWYVEYALVVELDGRQYHRGRALADMDRDNDHFVVGVATLRFGWRHVVGTPCRTARTVAAALQNRGWPGPLRPCPRCRAPL
jgi:very-short-patch-repair endonuclease